MATQNDDDIEFDALVREIVEDPEKINDPQLSPEQLLKIQERLNLCSVGIDYPEDAQKMVAASYSNMREEYIKKFTMTSLVGFMFRMAKEWQPDITVRRWTDEGRKEKLSELPAGSKKPFTCVELGRRIKLINDSYDCMLENQKPLLLSDTERTAREEVKALIRPEIEPELREIFKEKGGDDDYSLVAGTFIEEKVDQYVKDHEDEFLEIQMNSLSSMKEKQKQEDTKFTYDITRQLFEIGREADGRLDETEAEANRYPELTKSIQSNPIPELHRELDNVKDVPTQIANRIISDFLGEFLEYDPDLHVKSVYNKTAIELDEHGKDKVEKERLTLDKMKAKPVVNSEDKELYDRIVQSPERIKTVLNVMRCPELAQVPAHFIHYLAPLDKTHDARPAIEHIPPQDTFYRWNTYAEANFEELREATNTIYHDKPDLDFMLMVYNTWEGTTEANKQAFDDFIKEYEERIISDTKLITVGKWTLLGDFKKNRENIQFYNKNTEIIQRILDKYSEDKKLGKDLMKKRVKRAKAQNIKRLGPDDVGLADYMKTTSRPGRALDEAELSFLERAKGNLALARELEQLDGLKRDLDKINAINHERILTIPEMERRDRLLLEIKELSESIDVPANAVQVDVFAQDDQGQIAKTKFYTEAETKQELEARMTQ